MAWIFARNQYVNDICSQAGKAPIRLCGIFNVKFTVAPLLTWFSFNPSLDK